MERKTLMVNQRSPAIQHFHASTARVTVASSRAAAIQWTPVPGEQGSLGMITQLPQNAEVAICGDGFSDKTVKVCYHGSFYFIFRQDLAFSEEFLTVLADAKRRLGTCPPSGFLDWQPNIAPSSPW
jgi:hypothetical protein